MTMTMTEPAYPENPIYAQLREAGWKDVPLPQIVLPEATAPRLEMLESAITRYYEAQQRQVAGGVEYLASRYSRDPARHMRASALQREGEAAVYLAATELVTLGQALLRERIDALREKAREESVEAMKQTAKGEP